MKNFQSFFFEYLYFSIFRFILIIKFLLLIDFIKNYFIKKLECCHPKILIRLVSSLISIYEKKLYLAPLPRQGSDPKGVFFISALNYKYIIIKPLTLKTIIK